MVTTFFQINSKLKGLYLLFILSLFMSLDIFANEVDTGNFNIENLPPLPIPTVVVTPPSGSNCYSVVTASGCGTGTMNWEMWQSGSFTFLSDINPLTVISEKSIIIRAICYQINQNTTYSTQYTVSSATTTNIVQTSVPSSCVPNTGLNIITLNANSVSSGLSYQWQYEGIDISGTTSSSYTTTAIGQYSLVVQSGTCTAKYFPSFTIPIQNLGVIASYSGNNNGKCYGVGLFYINGTVPAGDYQWKLNGNVINGANSTSYVSYNTPGLYTVEYTPSGCSTKFTSEQINFRQTATPILSVSQSNNLFRNGDSRDDCKVLLTTTGFEGSEIRVEGREIGTTNWTGFGYTYGNKPKEISYYYLYGKTYEFRTVYRICDNNEIYSNIVTIASPQFFTTVSASSLTVCGDNASLLKANVNVTGPAMYQWKRNGIDILGANGANYSVLQGGNYTVRVSNGLCSYTSGSSNIVSLPTPTLSITSNSTSPVSIFNGQSITLTANGCTGSGSSILWSNGATNNIITVTPSINTNYSFTCTTPLCSSISSNFVVNVSNLLPPIISTSSNSTCTGNIINLSATNCLGGGIVSWNTGQTGSNISISPSITTSYTAICKIGTLTSADSVPIVISVFDGIIYSIASGNWDNQTTWSCNCIPAICNDVEVEVGHVVNIPENIKGKLKNLSIKGIVNLQTLGKMAIKQE